VEADGRLSTGGGPPVSAAERSRRRLTLALGRGLVAQKLGRHDEAIEALERAASQVEREPELWPVAPKKGARYDFGREEYRMLVAGLIAHSQRALGRLEPATAAMKRRAGLLEHRFEESDLDEDLAELAAAHHHLAEYAYRAGRIDDALAAALRGLELARRYDRRTGSTVTEVSLQLLRDCAELNLYGRVPLSRFDFDLKAELARAYAFICAHPSPRWAEARFLFELYRTMLEVDGRG
jgi:tetratricopeptide (TPR) repeat protein